MISGDVIKPVAQPAQRLRVLDATLRDGDQAAGFAFSVRAKLDIARALAASGVDIIEAGFPLSSALDGEACALIADEFAAQTNAYANAPSIALMCRAIPDEIRKTAAFFRSNTRGVLHLSLPVSDLHISSKLGISRALLLERAANSVRIARCLAFEVEMGAEDATRADREFLAEYCDAVTSLGARTVNIADTVGHALPLEFASLVTYLLRKVPAFRDGSSIISVHCHNDLGLASANTLAAIGARCGQIEVCALGLGERAGNAALEEIAAVLETRHDIYDICTGLIPSEIGNLTRLVSSVIGTGLSPLKPVTGSNIRAHASGIHQHGVSRNCKAYQSFDPSVFRTVPERIVLSRHSGRSGVEMAAIKYAGVRLTAAQAESLLGRIKNSCQNDASQFGITEFLLLLRDDGLVTKPIISCRDVALTALEGSYTLSGSFFRNDTRGTGYFFETGNGRTLIKSSLDLIRKLFSVEIAVQAINISGYGNGSGFRWRIYIEASFAENFAVERIGENQTNLLLAALLDLANVLCARHMFMQK